jgi:hypothetical protein
MKIIIQNGDPDPAREEKKITKVIFLDRDQFPVLTAASSKVVGSIPRCIHLNWCKLHKICLRCYCDDLRNINLLIIWYFA